MNASVTATDTLKLFQRPGRALGGDEVQHIGMVNAQHAHLCAPARTRTLHGGARLVEHVDVAARPRCQRRGALDLRTFRADAREVIADTTAPAHGFGGFAQRFIDAGVALCIGALDAVTYWLDEAVDERGLDARARCTHDSPCANRTGIQVGQKTRVPLGLGIRRFDAGQRLGHTCIQVAHGLLVGFQVFFAKDIETDGLLGGLEK
jgi:hypothetical protein